MRAARVDANQAEIVAGLRHYGCTVHSLHTVGKGVPDLLVGYDQINHLMEIKDPNARPQDRQLTPKQKEFFNSWEGSCHIVMTIEDAIEIVEGRQK